LVAVLALLATGCGDDDVEPTLASQAGDRPSVTISLTDDAVEIPDHLPGGLVDVTLDATGSTNRSHHLALFRLNDGVTAEELFAADDATFGTLVTYQAGNSQVNPGDTALFTFDLDPGDYAIADFDEGGNALTAITTVDQPAATASEPTSKGTIVLGPGMLITLPDDFDGTGVWKVENRDSELPHEAGLGRLLDGASVPDLVAWAASFDGPPPIEVLGGFGALGPGRRGWVDLGPSRQPGDHVVFCAIPGPDGVPHLAMGMATGFTLS
jgi:hypothetical protein